MSWAISTCPSIYLSASHARFFIIHVQLPAPILITWNSTQFLIIHVQLRAPILITWNSTQWVNQEWKYMAFVNTNTFVLHYRNVAGLWISKIRGRSANDSYGVASSGNNAKVWRGLLEFRSIALSIGWSALTMAEGRVLDIGDECIGSGGLFFWIL